MDVTEELRQLVEDIGRRSSDARLGRHGLPETFDAELWRTLDESGLTRLTTSEGAGPAEVAAVLGGLARHAAAVPIAETDLLAAWLASEAGLVVPGDGPMTVAIGSADVADGRVVGTAADVPWPDSPTVLLAAAAPDALFVAVLPPAEFERFHNLAGEPRGSVPFALSVAEAVRLTPTVYDELIRRGAWARCVQIVGALDAAAQLTAAHARERIQFGRPLKGFQAVQHSLAEMLGAIEHARAAIALAVAAAADHGFDSPQADYAVAVAKVTVGRAVGPVTRIAHQLHGAIGVTIEHPLWLATMRARSWADEFGTTAHHARRLGRMAMASANPWDLVIAGPESAGEHLAGGTTAI